MPKYEVYDVLIQVIPQLEAIKEKPGVAEILNHIKAIIQKNIEFVEIKDWQNHQICGDYPKVDVRCLAFCCVPSKKCPYRNAVLDILGLTIKDYEKMKKEFGEKIRGDKK